MSSPTPFDPTGNTGIGLGRTPSEQEQLMQAVMDAAMAEQQGLSSPASLTESTANQQMTPNPAKDMMDIPKEEQAQMLASALYGSDFPLLEGGQPMDDNSWARWVRGRWDLHRAAVERHLHLIERNRLFRADQQWVSSRGRGPWREPMRPTDAARLVYNRVAPALDQRLQILTDQRPGFKVDPSSTSPDDKVRAEARQMALEHLFDEQRMDEHMRTAAYWAQTDGLSFLHTFWDADAGPWDERMGENGNKKPLGDLRTTVSRVEQVRVSANATAAEEPYYVIVREVIPATEAAYRYGVSGVSASANVIPLMGTSEVATDAGMNRWVLDQTVIGEGDRLRNQKVVERFTIYIEPQADILPEGLQCVIVGDAVVWGPGPLLFGVIPIVPVYEGSSDPSYYKRPIMEQWLNSQVRINALISSLYDCIRVNKGGRFLARPGAISQETFIGGGTSVLEVNGIGSLDDVIRPVSGFSIGQDVKDALKMEMEAFDTVSGDNGVTRGQVSSDASGRAILAAREQVERIFTPPVQAMALAMEKWAKVQLAGMAWGYDIPRSLASVGTDRPDLARQLSKDDFAGPASVKVDKETLMPMPRAYRQFLLDDWLARGIIDINQYKRRVGFALIGSLDTPDEDQEARAMRIADAILTQATVPEMRWQDNEAIHQDILERRIILRDDVPEEVIKAAQARWGQLAQQSAQKQGGAPPPQSQGGAPPQQGPTNGGPPSPFKPSPQSQPLLQSNPSVAASPASGPPGLAGMQDTVRQMRPQ